MKRAPRRPYKPWFKKRKTGGNRFNKLAVDEEDLVDEPEETFVGYHLPNGENLDEIDDDDIRIIQFKVEDDCLFQAWNIYFPRIPYSTSPHTIKIIKAMIAHFQRYPHWYEIEGIIENSMFELRLENLAEDDALGSDWPSWYEDLRCRPDDVLSAVGLSIHTLLISDKKNNSLRKIHVRPNSFKPSMSLNAISNDNVGELVCTRGTIVNACETEFVTETLCFRCSLCSALIAVSQLKKNIDEELSEPTKCTGTCKGRNGMTPLYDSPFTNSYSRQIVTVQTISQNFSQSNRTMEVVLYRDLTDSFAVGQEVVIIGMVKQAVENYDEEENVKFKNFFTRKRDKETNPIILKTYLKCYTIYDLNREDESIKNESLNDSPELDLVTKLRSDPRVFKILLHSLCPKIAGREIAKSFALIALFGGHGLMGNLRRSSIHILLLGSSGTGKSSILQAAYECAPKGMSISAANISLAGLTAACEEHGNSKAGALPLCDGGMIYIDELDKMDREQQYAMISCMDSEVIHIHKNGCFMKLQARTNILAAANPSSEVYDYNQPVIANMSFPIDLLQKFDIVVPFLPNSEEDIEHFLTHFEKQLNDEEKIENATQSTSLDTQYLENEFFDSPKIDISANNYHWMKKAVDEVLPKYTKKDIQTYIRFAVDGCRPKLSKGAAKLLKFFYENYTKEIPLQYREVWSTAHNIESLTRLILARARIDFCDKATVEHAKQVLSLFKAAQIDVYPHHDVSSAAHDEFNNTMFLSNSKRPPMDISKMSKPKQMKALMEYLKEVNVNVFTTSQMMEIAVQLGIKEYSEIISRLNYEGFLLKTSEGYKLVKNF